MLVTHRAFMYAFAPPRTVFVQNVLLPEERDTIREALSGQSLNDFFPRGKSSVGLSDRRCGRPLTYQL